MLLHCLGLVLRAAIRATQCCLTVLPYCVFFHYLFYCLYCGQTYDDDDDKPHLTATSCHFPYGITRYLSPDTSEHTRLNPSQTGQYAIYLPQKDGRLS